MANAAGMLVSTVDDLWAFVSMLLSGGRHEGEQLLSPDSVADMTHDHLTEGQRASASLFLGDHGWGYGMATPGPLRGEPPIPWGFGWNGGTGTAWSSDPVRRPHRHPAHDSGDDLARATAPLRGVLGRRLRRPGGLSRTHPPPATLSALGQGDEPMYKIVGGRTDGSPTADKAVQGRGHIARSGAPIAS